MIIERSNGWTQFFVGLLKDEQHQGIQSFGSSDSVIAYLKSHPDQEFYLEPLLRGAALPTARVAAGELPVGDVFTGPLRYDTLQNKTICGEAMAADAP